MNLDGAMQAFFAEAEELLESMESALLSLEDGEHDSETLNEIFRAAHTIKGTAGLFGMDDIVSFTHVVENVLDRARDNDIEIGQKLQSIMLRCKDHIGLLLSETATNEQPDQRLKEKGNAILLELKPWLSDESLLESLVEDSNTSSSLNAEEDNSHNAEGAWHISLRLNPDVLQDGMDPISFIRYLQNLGKIKQLTTLTDSLPANSQLFNPEKLYLGFELDLVTTADKSEIESVFAFVESGSEISIIPPQSRLQEYIDLIKKLPEADYRLGEILVKSGAITQQELDNALDTQTVQAVQRAEMKMLGEMLTDQNAITRDVVDVALEKQAKIREKKSGLDTRFIRVDAEKLDRLINLIGELVISRQRVDLLAEKNGDGLLVDAVTELGGFTEHIRDAALTLRMVQIGDSFQRFRRVVRDTAEELGKDIVLKIRGAETELDRSMVEKLTDPLTHIVRNAMDHGIETPQVRIEKGKNAQGTLMLSAFHDSGNIVIEIKDDGNGINVDRIRNKAIERGIIDRDTLLSDKELKQLIFHPGLSTAEQVTNLSGRGVGMDVVKKNIDALQGSIDVESTLGVGTTIRIRLPLTLAIIDGFHVTCRGMHFIVPQNTVLECINLATLKVDEGRSCVNLRGEQIPTIKVSEIYALRRSDNPLEAIKEELVVVKFGDNRAGIIVEGLFGEIQTVVKPLSPLFQSLQGIGGSSLLGSGEIAFVLDIPQLIQLAMKRESDAGTQHSGCVIREK